MSDRQTLQVRLTFADRALSRVAGAPLIEGNHIRLLKDAQQNYPAWLDAIRHAKHHIYFETFICHQDEIGESFADALAEKAREGVAVRIVYDWLGCLGNASWRFWRRLRKAGVECRCYNPPRLDGPLAWISRDHRKVFAIDGAVGYISGLCIGKMWVGDPQKDIAAWRDTGIEVRGPAVAEIERAFSEMWSMLGAPIPSEETLSTLPAKEVGNMKVRIVPSLPATAGMIRTDQFIAALARQRLWLADAYYAGTTSYVQALRAAAMDNVDVRLLVPNSTDLPLLRPLSRTGYRTLLEAGVRIFEWNGPMMHAKTAVADGLWARVGSTNLNLASWFGNCELDALIEDETFATEMEAMYLDDLTNATEVVLDERHKVRPSTSASAAMRNRKRRGRARRAAAGAVRLGNAIGAALTRRRVLEPIEARVTMIGGVLLLAVAVLCAFYPKVVLYPLLTLLAWIGLGLAYRGYLLYRERKREVNGQVRRR
jgi:cardiolipin synthase